MARTPTMVEHYQSLLAQKEERLRSAEEALRTVLQGDITLVMDGPTPGIGFDYSYVPASPAVMLTLARLNRSPSPEPKGE